MFSLSVVQVLADAVILGGVFGLCLRNRYWWRSLWGRARGQKKVNAGEPTRRASLASISLSTCEST